MKFKIATSITVFILGVSTRKVVAQIQNPEWMNQVHISNTDSPFGLWVNPFGDIYDFGRITAFNGNFSGVTVGKTDQLGNEIWRSNFPASSENWQLFPKAITGDEYGDIYLLLNESYKYTDTTSNRICIKKMDPNGNTIWFKYLTELVNHRTEEVMASNLIYKNGALYLCGTYSDENLYLVQGMDGILLKVNSVDGDIIYRTIYNSIYDSDDVFRSCVVTESGEVHVIGRSRGYVGPMMTYSNYDAISVKFSDSGTFLWEKRFNGTSNAEDFGINIALDEYGNSYLSNQLKSIGINQKTVYINKIDALGNEVWTYSYQGSSSGYVRHQPIAVNANGNIVFVTSNENGIVIKCLDTGNGTEIWTSFYSRDNLGSQDVQHNMITNENGNIYITGITVDGTPYGQGKDMTTLCYNENGQLQWYDYINLGNYSTAGDRGLNLQWCPENNSLYVVGNGQNPDYDTDILIAKYGSGLSTVSLDNGTFSKVKVFPNPFNDQIIIESSGEKITSFQLYSINGTLLLDDKISDSLTMKIDTKHLAPGGYYIQINNGITKVYRLIKK
ncbi:T9SS type A sorting domain-containing protein [Paracrocinitomix mangrovi]|uniref:T9SS type A sorting domain-containing protein n=1 Tax=Paracrocinitomix mangrovi TaxID=2862509 RepID=UPI001C8CFB31|nr:T9SS type A sorting domain-containing protein [Paracrocinitomix mangrovi]UKN02267.1 T9SS type A sorting domain-containing protein [Paracrocinitomix mangrovi]